MASITESQAMLDYPRAVVDIDYATKLRDRYDGSVLDQRVDVLVEEVRAATYGKRNISDHAIIDIARQRRIHFFLTNSQTTSRNFVFSIYFEKIGLLGSTMKERAKPEDGTRIATLFTVKLEIPLKKTDPIGL